MDTSRLLFLILVVITTSECSETDEPQCENSDKELFYLLEGEAFYFEPSGLPNSNFPDEEFTWYKKSSKINISTDDKENIHYHGGALFFLNILPENSGFYTGRHTKPSGKCFNYHLEVNVVKARNDTAILYGRIETSDLNKKVPCPDPVSYTCEIMNGNITWYKDFNLLQGQHESDLWVHNTTKKDEGIYTCICTWIHNRHVYNSSGSRRLTVKETDEPQCENSDKELFYLLEGEAFYFEPSGLPNSNFPDEEFTWYKKNFKINISTDDKENIHYHGGALFFLNILPENSGFYTGRHTKPSGKCFNYHLEVNVVKARNDTAILYGRIENSDLNKKVSCPDPVSYTCEIMNGNITWYKDFNLLQGQHESDLWVHDTTKKDEGIYTCICTWIHNRHVYNSSGSRRLIVKERAAYRELVIISPSTTNKEQFADEGSRIKLNCSVFCGTNLESEKCRASWRVPFNQTDGYSQTTKVDDLSQNTISTETLTIDKVSAKDFLAEFKCIGEGFYETVSETLILKRRKSIIPLVIGRVSVLLVCVFAAMLVKCFSIDLALFFRPYFPQSSHNEDSRVYDAYVVYQMQSMDKVTEDTLCQFVTKNLPSVLEKKCGYRLFIHGRDDIPGEDRLELVEDRMKLSRRLMIILTPGSGSGSEISDQHPASLQNSAIGGFDWQVGLHHALIQREMSVILIQLGDTGPQGYSHLLPGLKHLIRKSAPIRWPEDSRAAETPNSRFWKRVRYLMPATPAKKCPQSAII